MVKKVTFSDSSVGVRKGRDCRDDDLSLGDTPKERSRVEAGRMGQRMCRSTKGTPGSPRHAFFGEDRCRAKFKLKEDEVVRVCGGARIAVVNITREVRTVAGGIYDTINTRIYVDGILASYRTVAEQEGCEAEHRNLVNEATAQLTGSRTYQEQLKVAASERTKAMSRRVPQSESGSNEGWDFDSDDDEETAGRTRTDAVKKKGMGVTERVGRDTGRRQPQDGGGPTRPGGGSP